MTSFTQGIVKVLEQHRNPVNAKPMAAYMKNKYPFLGIKTPEYRKLLQTYLKQYALPEGEDFRLVIRELWELPEREYQHVAMSLLSKRLKKLTIDDYPLIEYCLKTKQWWDSIDLLSSQPVGTLFALYPELKAQKVDEYMASGDFWLQRTCVLFQLKYKQQTDVVLLHKLISELSSSKEFFIQKAIGWILREYSKTNPKWVEEYIGSHDLPTLSKREGMKVILKARNME